MHLILAFNPKSGADASLPLVQGLQSRLTELGFECHLLDNLSSVRQLAHSLLDRDELKAVVAIGGDGTADALANLLDPRIPILLFPVGTENLLAKHFGLRAEIGHTCQVLLQNRVVRIDAGMANEQIFLIMASCGFDAEVVREMHAVRKGHISRWSYAFPIWRALRKYRFPPIPYRVHAVPGTSSAASTPQGNTPSSHSGESHVDDPASNEFAAWIFVFNVPRYAAHLDFCPQANPEDGKLDLCIFQRGGLPAGMHYLARLFLRSHQTLPTFTHRLCDSITISPPLTRQGSPDVNLPFQVDGDPGGTLPVHIKVLPRRVALVVP